jgi:hypothetical protein
MCSKAYGDSGVAAMVSELYQLMQQTCMVDVWHTKTSEGDDFCSDWNCSVTQTPVGRVCQSVNLSQVSRVATRHRTIKSNHAPHIPMNKMKNAMLEINKKVHSEWL